MHDALAPSPPAGPKSQRASRRGKNATKSAPKSRPAAESVERVLPRRVGRYTLFAHIGRGGMADIYLAQADTGLGGTRLVVIKEVLPRLAHSAEFAEMLVSEAKLAARLSHANVVKVEDLGRSNGALYIAMEYVEGLDLREMLRQCAKTKVALPVEFSLRIVIEVLRGLSFAHRAKDDAGKSLGIVHRDVSPSNVLLSFEGEVKVCDFGIARATPLAAELPDDAILGKAGYMSPEQARGDALDARADVFAAGIILWELLAGRRLYKAAEGERLLDVARAAVIPALPDRELPQQPELYAIVARALSVGREERYPTAAAMLTDLEDYAASARMIASPIRFGEWLMDQFGHEVVLDRRARERVMQALSRGPAAVIAPVARTREEENTPSAFPVALRADPESSEPIVIDEAREREEAEARPAGPISRVSRPTIGRAASAIVPRAPSAPIPAAKASSFQARFLVYAIALSAIAYLALRMFVI